MTPTPTLASRSPAPHTCLPSLVFKQPLGKALTRGLSLIEDGGWIEALKYFTEASKQGGKEEAAFRSLCLAKLGMPQSEQLIKVGTHFLP